MLWPEDVMHMIFKCQGASEIWRALRLDDIITVAIVADRSGSVVLEELLKATPSSLPGYNSLKVQEIIAIGAWYLVAPPEKNQW
jgi:hypothetical protein